MAATAISPVPPPVRVNNVTGHSLYGDPRNTIARPTGPQYQFALTEGIYNLRDEISLGAIHPHPTDGTIHSTNVLDTKLPPLTAGSKLTLAALAPRKPTSFRRRSLNVPSFKSSFSPSITDSSGDSSHQSSDRGSSKEHSVAAAAITKSRFGEGNTALFPLNVKEAKDPLKRRKPKNGITKSSSSFISRAIPSDNIGKRVQEHSPEGTYAFANMSRGFLWLDLSSQNKHDQMTKILFTKAHALCHDFNELTRTPSHLDLIIGFNTSELIWYEPMSQKYSRLNKNATIISAPITQVKWLPGSENLFIAAHLDGTLIIYDKEKDDAPFVPEDGYGVPSKVSSDGKRLPRLIVKKSVQSKAQKTNPVSVWKATNQRINAMAFSPNGKFLALACEDGSLRILDYANEELIDLYRSYYGGLTCVCWSPDGAYIVTGGQDDLISIWSLEDRILVARCIGHKSWIAHIAFDPWHCDESIHRLGSVAEDGRLLFWDFSVDILNPPRASSIRQSISSYAPNGLERSDIVERSDSVVTMTQQHHIQQQLDQRSHMALTQHTSDEDSITHPILPRAAVALLLPLLSKEVDVHAMSWIGFEEDCIITACRAGHIQTWDRPKREGNGADATVNGNGFAKQDFANGGAK